MSTIWRFEDDFVTSCDSVMKEALSILGCDVPVNVFLVGIDILTNEVTVNPMRPSYLICEVEDPEITVSDVFVPFPQNQTVSNEQWDLEYKKHDDSCWECWRRIRDALRNLYSQTAIGVEVSPHAVN